MRLAFPNKDKQIVPVDWDQDGDLDLLVLALEYMDAQYFEQQANGSFREKPLEETPFKPLLPGLALHPTFAFYLSWHFLDCDEDGDLDLVQAGAFVLSSGLQACKHDNGTLDCTNDFLCLGTDVSRWRNEFKGFGEATSLSLSRSADGRLRIVASHKDRKHAVLWTAGFCKPRDPCNQKGSCNPRQASCECMRGYELEDCSRCEPQYYTASLDGRQMRSCKACPGEPNLCYGRGRCFDDVAAQDLTNNHAAALATTGNGSCLCYEAGWRLFWKSRT